MAYLSIYNTKVLDLRCMKYEWFPSGLFNGHWSWTRGKLLLPANLEHQCLCLYYLPDSTLSILHSIRSAIAYR